MRHWCLCSLLACVMLSGCAHQYVPLQLDEKSLAYPTSTQVDPGGVLAYNTQVNPKIFPVVLLVANSNNRASIFEFTMRTALAQLNATDVFNPAEFRKFAADRHVVLDGDKLDGTAIQRFSNTVAPVLLVEAVYRFVGDARMMVGVRVTDGRTGTVLLAVNHPRTVWNNFDSEALYPMLNQLRRWYLASSKQSA